MSIIIWVIVYAFVGYFVVVMLINMGIFRLGKFRLIKRQGIYDDNPKWIIQERLLGLWWKWNCDGEYWSGDYDNFEEAKKDFKALTTGKRKQEVVDI